MDAVIDDPRNRCTVCTACGYTIEEILDDWSHAQYAENVRMHASTEKAQELRHAQSTVDRDLYSVLAIRLYLDDVLERARITLSGTFVDYALSMFQCATRDRIVRGDHRRGLIAACLKQAMAQQGRTYDTPTMAFIFDVPPAAVAHGCELLAECGMGPSVCEDSVDFLARSIANRMGLDPAIVVRVSEQAVAIEPLRRDRRLMAARPRSLAAASVWLALDVANLQHRWADLELASGVTRPTFTAFARKIRQVRDCATKRAPPARSGTGQEKK